MSIPRPSLGTVLGGLALIVALGGTAWAVTASKVNIADPTTPTQIAHVDAGGHLQVAGTVTAQLTPPADYVHPPAVGATKSLGCRTIITPPAGDALIVREVRLDVYADPSPGLSQNIGLYVGSGCSTIVGDVNPAGLGQVVVPFDPGLGVPAGENLSVLAGGSVASEVYVDAYTVPASRVPASAPGSTRGAPQQREMMQNAAR